jgi:hypothetical protein
MVKRWFVFRNMAITILVILSASLQAQADLINRGGGLIYDIDLNITWLQDANYTKTSGYDADGLMDAYQAKTWAENLVYGGYNGWRLPTTPGTGSGFLSEGEMGHLYYDMGIRSFSSSPFINVQSTNLYWTGTDNPDVSHEVWVYYFSNGYQILNVKNWDGYAWAVHNGDIGASVPIPEALWLFGSGLLGLLGLRRK